MSDEGDTAPALFIQPASQAPQPQAHGQMPEPPLIRTLEDFMEEEQLRIATQASLEMAREKRKSSAPPPLVWK